jgi:CBS domain-containing protein
VIDTDKDNITYTLPDLKVEEIMTKEIITIDKEAPILELVEMFNKHHKHGFPVLHEGKLVGIVSKIDLLKTFSVEGTLSRGGWSKMFATHIKDIMTAHPKTVSPEAHTIEALDKMLGNDLRLLPVVKEDELLGILSYTDIARHVKVVSR